jgi:hypothetical protein
MSSNVLDYPLHQKGGSLFNKLTVGFQLLGGEGGDQPFGVPGNVEGTMFGLSQMIASSSLASTKCSI